MSETKNIKVAALYKFVTLHNYKDLREPLLDFCKENLVKGTLLLAKEGINGTIAGPEEGIDRVIAYLRSIEEFKDGLSLKYSYFKDYPFLRMKVKLKKEIVTLGVEGINPNRKVGTYLSPREWNELISRDDVIVIDTRNIYEYEIGTFKGAINPMTNTFREFPEFVAKNLDTKKHKKVAMFCTGGIRCEKSTSYLLELGFEEVYHLDGGVLRYLEEIPEEEGLWEGQCFVFDERVSVGYGLKPGNYDQCYACRNPISEEEKQSKYYQKGVSCPKCYHTQSAQNRKRAQERQRQIELSKQRGEKHLARTWEY